MATTNATRTNATTNRGVARKQTFDAETLMKIKSLELRAKVIVEGFMHGIHRSPYHGFSVEFTDYRQYSPGDDLRYLDWKLLARSDRKYIKRFEDETNLRCYLLADMSKSMGYGSLDWNKSEYAKTAAATFAYFLALQRDAVGLLTFDQAINEFMPARYRPGHLRRIMLSLENALGGQSTDITGALEQIAKTVRKRSLILLISDLLAPIDSLERCLGYLRSQGHEVAILRILDPTEVDFDFRESAMFLDSETGRDLYIDPQSVRNSYLEKFNAHQSAITTCCQKLGIDFHSVTTDKPLDEALSHFIMSRAERSEKSHRQQVRQTSSSGGIA
jgi:uncharacterized protein (DUF58 family)